MSPRLGRARRLNVVIGLAVLVMGMLGGTFTLFGRAAQASVNLSCPDGTSEYKVDGNPLNGLSTGESAQVTVSGVTFTFTKVVGPSPFEDDTFDFTSTIAVTTVLVKGGVPTNVYNYNPATTSGSALHPPLNDGGQAPAISHVSFCIGESGTTTTSTTVPQSSTSTSTSTTVPETTTSTSTTVPETTTSTSTTVPETTTSTSTTVPETTTTSTTVPETTTTIQEQGSTTTSTTELHGTTTIFTTTTTQPETTTTLREQGGTIPTTTTEPVTVPGTLPRTGSSSAVIIMFALSCIAAGGLLMIRKRSWSRP
jgi:LPXTG-motif cell wall-anchored protein